MAAQGITMARATGEDEVVEVLEQSLGQELHAVHTLEGAAQNLCSQLVSA